MSFFSDESFHNMLSFVLFCICAGLVGLLVWVLLRRLQRRPQMCDQETMTVEPSAKQGKRHRVGHGRQPQGKRAADTQPGRGNPTRPEAECRRKAAASRL
ncbi:hypothetical protein MTO96_047351, partial [Rhipicephalus appendiculatus]